MNEDDLTELSDQEVANLWRRVVSNRDVATHRELLDSLQEKDWTIRNYRAAIAALLSALDTDSPKQSLDP